MISAQEIYIFSCSDGYRRHGILCRHRINAGLFRDQVLETANERVMDIVYSKLNEKLTLLNGPRTEREGPMDLRCKSRNRSI